MIIMDTMLLLIPNVWNNIVKNMKKYVNSNRTSINKVTTKNNKCKIRSITPLSYSLYNPWCGWSWRQTRFLVWSKAFFANWLSSLAASPTVVHSRTHTASGDTAEMWSSLLLTRPTLKAWTTRMKRFVFRRMNGRTLV
jgi:hypothetical protein